MEAIAVLAWVSAIIYSAFQIKKYGPTGVIIIVGAVLLSWLGVLIGWGICEGIKSAGDSSAEKKKVAANTTSAQDFVQSINTANKLYASSIIDAREFSAKKAEIISNLATKRLAGAVDEFLLAIAPLKQSNVLTDVEVQQIKKMLIGKA